MDTTLLVNTARKLWSAELHRRPDARWVLFRHGTMVTFDARKPPQPDETLQTAAERVLHDCERIPGSKFGDFSIQGPDARFPDATVLYMTFPAFPQVFVLHADAKQEEQVSRHQFISPLLGALESDRAQPEVIASTEDQ